MQGMEIMKEGLLTTVQDLGRYGFQKDGMVVAGAMDTYALQIANLLVGNRRNESGLEITMIGPRIKFRGRHLIALCGGDFSPRLNSSPVPQWQTVRVQDGDELVTGHVVQGCRAYLAVQGGLRIPQVLGSSSTYLKAGIGGWQGRALAKGDFIPTNKAGTGQDNTYENQHDRSPNQHDRSPLGCHVRSRRISPELQPIYSEHARIRVVMGPQDDAFTAQGLQTFLQSTYTVTPESDRMGYRLQGPRIEHRESADIVSDAIPVGGIQVPQDGQPILLMADRQPTGGYTKIATVISTDIPKVAQLVPGNTLSFEVVTITEAQKEWMAQEKRLRMLEKISR